MSELNFHENTIINGRFKIIELLNDEGVFSEVYLAEDQKLHRKVALKVLRPSKIVRHERLIEDFEKEIKILCELKHENIVDIIDYGKLKDKDDTPSFFVALEYIRGGNIEDKQFNIDRAVVFCAQACDALAHMHTHQPQVIHRDIKPSNILLDGSTIKLADFGFAKVLDGSGNSSVIGTPAYASPEQVDGEKVTPASDLYSLAKTLYTMVTGRTYRSKEQITSLPEKYSKFSWSGRFLEVLKNATEPNPSKRRYKKAEEFKIDLLSIIMKKGVDKKVNYDKTVVKPIDRTGDNGMENFKNALMIFVLFALIILGSAWINHNWDTLWDTPRTQKQEKVSQLQNQPTSSKNLLRTPVFGIDNGYTDWKEGYIYITDFGTPKSGVKGLARKQATAMEAARVRAAARAGRQIEIELESRVELTDLAASRSVIRSKGKITGIEFVRTWVEEKRDGSILGYATVRIPLKMFFGRYGIPALKRTKPRKAFKYEEKPLKTEPVKKKEVSPPKLNRTEEKISRNTIPKKVDTVVIRKTNNDTRTVTGIIIDVGGRTIRPAMAPKILLEDTYDEIYTWRYVDTQYLLEKGVAGYIRSLDDKKYVKDRVGDSPLIIKAKDVLGANVIISRRDAIKLYRYRRLLSRCRVVISLNGD